MVQLKPRQTILMVRFDSEIGLYHFSTSLLLRSKRRAQSLLLRSEISFKSYTSHARKMTSTVKSSLLNLGFLILLFLAINCGGESSTCLTVYKEGGAPAVFQSPKCPRWNLHNWGSPTHNGGGRCHVAAIQGRRKYQEDRVLCAFDLRIPFPGKSGTKDVLVGIAAVFDGHNGPEASEMASKLLLDYFALHINFLLDATFSAMTRKLIGKLPATGEHGVILHGLSRDEIMQFQESLLLNFDDSLHLDIMKDALLRAIHDIDATFTKEASNQKLNSGSTATIALIADGQLMVASIGDSKALLCSEKFETQEEARATLVKLYRERRGNRGSSPTRFSEFKLEHSNGRLRLIAKELTKDHHPNREDEKIRVEAAGGYVTEWAGVPRVNGQLAVSRSIGDVTYKSYGVISAPEVMDWQPLMANDSYLVVSSDGIFEKLEVQDVCDRLWEVNNQTSSGAGLPSYCSISLADCLVNTALEKGSMDNMAAVVVPLKSNLVSQLRWKEQSMSDDKDKIASALPSNTCALPLPNDLISGPLQLKQAQPLATMFNRLLVEVKNGSFCRFYMSENLIGASHGQMDNLNGYMGDLPQVLPASAEPFSGWCLPSGTAINENQDQCINPDSFATFLGLLESVPLHGFGANNGTDEILFPDSSYVLKKKFGRGAFGEVWLAFHWNCYQGNNATSWIKEDENTSKNDVHINEYTDKVTSNISTDHYDADGPDNSFILKRIMVERGPTVYLSGLREKHFGELFLNAFNISGSSSATQTSSSQSASSELDLSEEGLKHIARYIEYFESRYNDIWLVFHHEGVSLSKLMYTVEEAENTSAGEKASHGQILRPSKWWTWLKTTESGKEEMRRIIWQLLLGLKACHDRNITHRDIKPENMVICLEDIKSGRCLKGVPNGDHNFKTKMRIIDFGSALDEFTMKHLYGSTGPSRAEQTHDYAPPEAILNSSWHRGPTSLTLKYDMWSVGVVMLEMILGSPNVFEISPVTRALLDQHIRGWSENFKELAYKLRSFMEMCILIPGSSLKHGSTSSKQGGISLASWKCSEEFFAEQIKSRDRLKIGFPNVWALRLVRGLLQWYPEDRMNVDEALQHPYFQPPPSS